MPILQRSLEEPLLSRQEAAVIREIARAAQLTEAWKTLDMSVNILKDADVFKDNALKNTTDISNYLKAEITRVLMLIKVPANPIESSSALANVPGKGTK